MPEALELAKELIARKSITPEDGGCQELITKRLTAAGFKCEPMNFGDVEAFLISCESRSMIDCGVLAGAYMPNHD